MHHDRIMWAPGARLRPVSWCHGTTREPLKAGDPYQLTKAFVDEIIQRLELPKVSVCEDREHGAVEWAWKRGSEAAHLVGGEE